MSLNSITLKNKKKILNPMVYDWLGVPTFAQKVLKTFDSSTSVYFCIQFVY